MSLLSIGCTLFWFTNSRRWRIRLRRLMRHQMSPATQATNTTKTTQPTTTHTIISVVLLLPLPPLSLPPFGLLALREEQGCRVKISRRNTSSCWRVRFGNKAVQNSSIFWTENLEQAAFVEWRSKFGNQFEQIQQNTGNTRGCFLFNCIQWHLLCKFSALWQPVHAYYSKHLQHHKHISYCIFQYFYITIPVNALYPWGGRFGWLLRCFKLLIIDGFYTVGPYSYVSCNVPVNTLHLLLLE